jgi:phosphohistidine swiveling domain-containing protein
VTDRWITDWTPSVRWPHYTRANSGEVLPTPASPLGQQFTWENGIVPGWRDGYVIGGCTTLDEYTDHPPATCGFFGGYFYINLSNVRMQGARNPALTVEQLDLAFFGEHPDVPPYVADPRDDRPDLAPRILERMGWVMTAATFPEIDAEREQTRALAANRPDLASLSDAELVAYARSTQPLLGKLFESHTITSGSSGIAPGVLAAIGAAVGDPTIAMTILAGIGDVDSAEPSYAMWELSRQVRASAELTALFDAGVAGLLDRLYAAAEGGSADARAFLVAGRAFLQEFGSRGPNEWEISADTWGTDPSIALAAIDRVRLQSDDESPRARNARRAAERQATIEAVRAKLAEIGNDELTGTFEAGLVAGNQMAFRERTKTNIIRAVHEGRLAFRELARRHTEAGHLADPRHIFMLLDAELERFVEDPASFRQTLADRYAQWEELWDLEPPFFIVDGQVPPLSQWRRRTESTAPKAQAGEVLTGVAGCPGVVRGTARIVTDPSDPGALDAGDILVAPITDPAWTPLFMAAGGVVVNVGGQISHAIIVSRELGLPCVVSVTDATVRIPDGALVEVDGTSGTVTVIEVPSQ